MSKTPTNKEQEERQPVVAIVGHVDHGKSTLLDYIRKTNVVDSEAGGITQAVSAYVAEYNNKKITFLDTPGHAAFQNMRERGLDLADIAILIVSADDGVMEQTKEAFKAIEKIGIPFIVAISKIDKPGANLEKTKNSLIENGIYLEGMGGNVTYVPISSKSGEGVNELLENIILIKEMSELKYSPSVEATGRVLESFVDQKRGISATLIIRDGTLPTSGAILTGVALSPIRIIEDFKGKTIKNPIAGEPIKVTGFDTIPQAGSIFISSADKKELENVQKETINETKKSVLDPRIYRNAKVVIPVIIKTSSLGSLEAVRNEIKKNETDDVKIKIIGEGVGNITEGDILLASGDNNTTILGFEANIEAKARDQADRFNIKPETFDIIYKLSERFKEIVQDKLPYEQTEKIIGQLKVLKTFSANKDVRVVGGKVIEGAIRDGASIKIIRREYEIGKGKIIGLQQMKMKAKEVLVDNECGVEVDSRHEIIPGDLLTVVEIEKKKMI
ncbi:MAG: translation initiation factor [Patescibacteria group bacterium]|nr:translation initiation factor [Patescibacteria group bacterium]